MMSDLLALVLVFGQLSVLAIGGPNPILPEMRRQAIDVHHWLTAPDFAALFGLAQAAPGPNMMVVTLIGWQAAGLPGALIATLAIFGPSSLLAGVVFTTWNRLQDQPWSKLLRAGLAPVTIGLSLAGAGTLAWTMGQNWLSVLIIAGSAIALVRTRLPPFLIMAAGGLIGLAGSFW